MKTNIASFLKLSAMQILTVTHPHQNQFARKVILVALGSANTEVLVPENAAKYSFVHLTTCVICWENLTVINRVFAY